jgi:chromosome segregation ATPase
MWRAALVDAEAAVQRARAAHAEANEQEPDWLTEATLMLESLHAESEEGEEEVGGAAPRASASTDERAQLQAALDEARADAERARVEAERARAEARQARAEVREPAGRPGAHAHLNQLSTELSAALVIVLAVRELLRPLLR